jgi:hypothetical protein
VFENLFLFQAEMLRGQKAINSASLRENLFSNNEIMVEGMDCCPFWPWLVSSQAVFVFVRTKRGVVSK